MSWLGSHGVKVGYLGWIVDQLMGKGAFLSAAGRQDTSAMSAQTTKTLVL